MNRSAVTTIFLVVATVVVLILNYRFLYTTPFPNTWVWWIGDETWLLAQSKEFVLSGHYINPLAPGSEFAHCSGLLFGSCYVAAAIYGVPQLFIHGSTVDLGRTISFLIGVLTLVALWLLARRYEVPAIVRTFGIALLASTISFFMASHSARTDMLAGLTLMVFTGILPLIADRRNASIILGMVLPLGLLVNGHVAILSFLMVGYLMFTPRCNIQKLVVAAAVACGGFFLLFLAQVLLQGSTNIFGPFSGSSVMMPVLHITHLKTDLANIESRFQIAQEWAPGVVGLSAIVALASIAKFRSINFTIQEKRLLISTALVILSATVLEFYWERYLIFVLPTIVLAMLLIWNSVLRTLAKTAKALFIGLTILCLGFGLWSYYGKASRFSIVGETVTNANTQAVESALQAIHSRGAGVVRVFTTVPTEAVAMDDSCTVITPVMFVAPIDTSLTREQIWKNANIQYAIVCDAAHRDRDWDDIDTHIYGSKPTLIFERVGPFSDIGRTEYDPADLKNLDTLRVYEFEN